MLLLNQFWPYSDSWHGTVNSEVKQTKHGVGMLNINLIDKCMSMGMHCVVVLSAEMPGMNDVFAAVVNEYFMQFKEKPANVSYYMSVNHFLLFKIWQLQG